MTIPDAHADFVFAVAGAQNDTLIGMVVATAKHGSKSKSPVRWQRYLTLLTDALRTPAPTPLPPR